MRRFRSALIVGASGGLGRALAFELAPVCDSIFLASRNLERLSELRSELTAKHPGCAVRVFGLDLESADSVGDFLARIGEFPALDLLIMNAGYGTFKKFLEADWSDHRATVMGNLLGTMKVVHALLPGMGARALASGYRAELMLVSSHSSGMRIPHFSVYVPAKTFITQWGRTLAMELKDQGVGVTIPCPGAMATEFSVRSGIPKMVSTPEPPGKIAKDCVSLIGKGGVHYLNWYDRFLQFANWISPVFLMDAVVDRVQQRALSRLSGKT